MMKFNYKKLRNIRAVNSISMQEAAAHVKHNVSWLSSVENGRTAPNINDLLALLDLYNETLDTVIMSIQYPGSYLSALKMSKGWSDQQVADILGCSVEDWRAYEEQKKPMNMFQTLTFLNAADIKDTKQAQAVHVIVNEYLEAHRDEQRQHDT